MVTFVSPTASSSISGENYLINVSLAGFEGTDNWTCSVYAKSASTANSSWSFLLQLTNETSISANGTWAKSTGIEDSNDYQFNATCNNNTQFLDDVVITGITIDNTVPTAPTLNPVTNTLLTTKSTTTTFTGTVTDSKTTGCTYVIARGGTSSGNDYTSGTATYSASTCTFTKTFTDQTSNGVWYWSVTASDGTNTSNSGANYQVSIPPTGGSQPIGAGVTTGRTLSIVDTLTEGNNWIWGVVIVIVIMVIVILVKRK